MASINSTATKKGRCKSTFAVLPVGEFGEARKVNLRDDDRPTYIRLGDGSVQRLRSVTQIKAAEAAGLGPVTCAQLQKGQIPTFHPANQVSSVAEGTAAHKAGVLPGDEIDVVTLIDPATGKPVLGEDGLPVSARSADARRMRQILEDHPDGRFALNVRRDGATITLTLEGQRNDADKVAWETAEAAHEAWRKRIIEQQGEGPIYATTQSGRVDINRPFSELPAEYVRSLKNAADTAYREAVAYKAMLQGQGSDYEARGLLRAGADRDGLAERLYQQALEGDLTGVPYPSAPEDVRARYQALAAAMLKAAPEQGTLHGINAPFGPAVRGEYGDGYRRLSPEILTLAEGGAAVRAGLKSGDRIVGIEGRPGLSLSEIQQIVRSSPGENLRLIVESSEDGPAGGRPLDRLRTVTVTLDAEEGDNGTYGALGVRWSSPDKNRDLSQTHSLDALCTPTPPEFRILSKEARNEVARDLLRGGKGYGLHGYGTDHYGSDSYQLRTLESHKHASGKGAALATASAAPPLPTALTQKTGELYSRGVPGQKAAAPVPIEQFAPEGMSPVEAALTRTGAPVPVEITGRNVKAKLAAGIMVAQLAGVDVANDPGAMARIRYIESMDDAPWEERIKPGSVYEAFAIAMDAESSGSGVDKVAEWIVSGSSDKMVSHLKSAGRKRLEVTDPRSATSLDRTQAGTVILTGRPFGRYDYGLSRTGHDYGQAVVCAQGGMISVTVADAPADTMERIVSDLNSKDSATARGGGRWYLGSPGPDGVASALATGSVFLAPEEVAEVVDWHLPARTNLPDLPEQGATLSARRVTDDPAAHSAVHAAIDAHHSSRRGWEQVARASSYGYRPDKVAEYGLNRRDPATDAVLLQPENLTFTGGTYPTDGITLAVMSDGQDGAERKVIIAQGVGTDRPNDYSKWNADFVAVQTLPQSAKEQTEQTAPRAEG